MKNKLRTIDLFAGCGGLLEGFLKTNCYKSIASVEWEKSPSETLKNRLVKKWSYKESDNSVIRFDIQRTEELFQGFEDEKYGIHKGLDSLIGEGIDIIIGGPPCQAYSVAGRVRDKDYMKNDYRNYLFEYYLKIVERYQPKLFVFENVPGMLSAMPDGTLITDLIRRDINDKGYEIINNIRNYAVLDSSQFGVPQNRKRVILLGLNKKYFSNLNIQEELEKFYKSILPKYFKKQKNVEDAIGDLPKCFPLKNEIKINGRKYSHDYDKSFNISWHFSRFHSKRDIKIFHLLAKDIENGTNEYTDSEKLKELYNKITGSNTNVHKYHVLRKDKPSTTILAHLHKDGLRFIHYDSNQARTITVREAARLQSFDDDFEFIGSMGDAYKMIGNAVPPLMAEGIANAIVEFLKEKEN